MTLFHLQTSVWITHTGHTLQKWLLHNMSSCNALIMSVGFVPYVIFLLSSINAQTHLTGADPGWDDHLWWNTETICVKGVCDTCQFILFWKSNLNDGKNHWLQFCLERQWEEDHSATKSFQYSVLIWNVIQRAKCRSKTFFKYQSVCLEETQTVSHETNCVV